MATKRGQGEGSIYRRKDGLWVAQIFSQGRKLYKYCKTQRQALDWLQETRNQIQNGLSLAVSRITLAKYLEEWLAAYSATVRPKTIQQYTQIVNQHVSPVIGGVKLKDLRPDHIQTLYGAKLREGTSERTVLLIHAVLHRALNQALRWGLIGRNPAQGVTRPRLRRKEMQTLTDAQVRNLLETVRGSRLEALFWLAVATGLREGEILGLKWSDLDRNARQLRIQRQLQRLKQQGLVFTEPKSAAGKRAVVLSSTILSKLRVHRTIQAYESLFAGHRWQENDLVFCSTIGTPLDPRNLYQHFKDALKKAGLPEIRFHDLRHTAATLMLQQGVHPKVVQEQLGHADISLTLNTYSHVLPTMQQEAAEKIEKLLVPLKPDRNSEYETSSQFKFMEIKL